MGKAVGSTWWIALVCVALCACAEQHGPKSSTETGNPPVIDAALISLVMRGDDVHMTGEKGAVSPGGSDLAARNLTNSKVVHGTAAQNGSFDLELDGALDDVYELRASSGEKTSAAVFVDQNGASTALDDAGAPAIDAGALSCAERERRAATSISQVVGRADLDCSADADCVSVPTNAICHDACSDAIVSKVGRDEVLATISVIDTQLCNTYESDGCVLIAQPCVPPQPGSPACVAGTCKLGPEAGSNTGNAGTCDERQMEASTRQNAAIAAADRTCTDASDCIEVPTVTGCIGGCTTLVSSEGKAQIEAAIAAIDAEVCADFEGDGCTVLVLHCPAEGGPLACIDGTCGYQR